MSGDFERRIARIEQYLALDACNCFPNNKCKVGLYDHDRCRKHTFAFANKLALPPETGAFYRNHSSGTLYQVVAMTMMGSVQIVIYQSTQTLEVLALPLPEFMDGRYEPVQLTIGD